ncbi:exo-alpha-sialidase [candidate division WOR-3 bacterium]|nr:exo-alpha-sialidase [candidate division WOR-3 bacterium]
MRISIVVLLVFLSLTVLHAQWEPAQRLSENGKAQPGTARSVSSSFGGMVHVVWSDTRDVNSVIDYKRSTDYGKTWEDEIRFADTESNAENPGVSIAGVMNPVVHVVWDDDRDGNKEIYYKRSSDWGITWSEDIPITADGFLQEPPNLSFCRADVQAVWIDHRSGKTEIWGSHSTDCGVTWSPAISISQPEHAWAGFATIVHVDSTYHVVWTARIDLSNPPFYSIYYRSTNDLGLTWNPIRRIATHETAYPPVVSCAAMKENVHLTWGIPGQGLFYRRSTSSGFTWEGNVCLKDAADVYDPCIAISGKYVHVVWYEKVGKTAYIYYMRNLTGNPIGPPE